MRRKRYKNKPKPRKQPVMTAEMKASALQEWTDVQGAWTDRSTEWKLEAVSVRLQATYGYVFDHADIRSALPEGTV